MTSNIVKNLAAATVAGTFLSFAIASTTVSLGFIVDVASGHLDHKTAESSLSR